MPDPQAAREPRRGLWLALGVVLLVAVGYGIWGSKALPPRERTRPDITRPEADDEPLEARAPENPGYLGPQSCAPCHAARVAEFARTAHARACRRPDDGPMPAGFEPGKNRFTSSDGLLQFEMSRSGNAFSQNVRRGGTTATLGIDLVYGANHADEVFFSWKDNRIREMMAVWLHPRNGWAHTSYDQAGAGSFSRETTPRCLECHNTWMAHVPGTMNEYHPEGTVLGASCEKCHGPGREHVAHHRTHPEAKTANAILHPGRFDRERSIETCTQCHGNYTKARGPAFAHRPGVPLERDYRLAQTRHPEDDHVANQIKYLRQSKCFAKSEMTCATCHDPHRPHEPNPAADREACLKCHEPAACKDRPNLPGAVRDDCVKCHMPPRVWINVHFHTETDRYLPPIRRVQHRIAVDPVARDQALFEWHVRSGNMAAADPLRASLGERWLRLADEQMRDHRFLAANGSAREALRLEPNGSLREKAAAALRSAIERQTKLDAETVVALQAARDDRLLDAIDSFERTLAIKPDFALANSKLGTLNAMAGRTKAAVKHLEAVAADDPDNASGLAMLGWLAYLDERHDEAIGHYRRAVEIEPWDAKIEYHWGLAALATKRWAEAEAKFRKALAIEPRHAGARQGLSHVLREQGNAAEAVRAARTAARLTAFGHADILVTLADAYDAAHREAEAAAAAALALELQPSLPDATRRRMQTLRDR